MLKSRVFMISSMALVAAFGVGPGATSTAHAEITAAPIKVGKASSIELKPAIVAYSDSVTLRAMVFTGEGASRTPIADGDVDFRVGGQSWGTAKTNASGLATLTVRPSGMSPLQSPFKTSARFAGKGDILASTDDATLAIIKGSPTWKSASVVGGASDVQIKGWIETPGAGVGGGRTVTVKVNGNTVKTVDNWDGITLPYSGFALGANKVHLQFEGNEYYAPTATELAFFRKRDTNVYFEPTFPAQAPYRKAMTIRVRVGQGATDSPTAVMFVPGRSVGVKLVEEHPYYATQAKIGYKRVEHKAETDAAGWATFTTSDDWVDVETRTPSLAGRQVEHRISVMVDDDQFRADPKPAHVRSLTVKK